MSTLDGMTMKHPDVVLKNESSMVQTCLNTNMHVVNPDIIMLRPTWMFV